MDLVNTILNILDSEETRSLGTQLFVGAVIFDFLLSYDKVPGNSVREWLLTVTQRGLLVLPGPVTPYALAVLVGHFYHPPDTQGILPLGGYWNLGVVVIIGLILAITSWLMDFPKSKHLVYIPIFGVIIGSVIWPV